MKISTVYVASVFMLLSAINAHAVGACNSASVALEIAQLGAADRDDRVTGEYPSSTRQIESRLKYLTVNFCVLMDNPPVADHTEEFVPTEGITCQLMSGSARSTGGSRRVFWTECPDYAE